MRGAWALPVQRALAREDKRRQFDDASSPRGARFGGPDRERVAFLPAGRQGVKGLGQMGIGVKGRDKLIRQNQCSFGFGGLGSGFGMGFGLRQKTLQNGRHGADLRGIGETGAIRDWTVLALPGKQARGIVQEACIEKGQPDIAAKGAENRDVAACMHIARVAPFRSFDQTCIKAKRPKHRQPFRPEAGRAGIAGKTVAAPAAILEELCWVGDHGAVPLRRRLGEGFFRAKPDSPLRPLDFPRAMP